MRALLLGAAMVFAATGAFAGDDVMANYYGNTVVSKSANGESHTHYKKGGTLDATLTGMMGSINLTGTWKIDDKGQLCRTYDNPPPMLPIPNPFCTAWEAHKVGDTWTVTVGGQTRTITLVAGVQ
jgi:hypothetical protein